MNAYDQVIDVLASWIGDGYLHIFESPFTPDDLNQCLVGDDDFNGTTASLIEGFAIAAGQTVTIVASTFSSNDPIGDYTITVSTQ